MKYRPETPPSSSSRFAGIEGIPIPTISLSQRRLSHAMVSCRAYRMLIISEVNPAMSGDTNRVTVDNLRTPRQTTVVMALASHGSSSSIAW